MVIDDLKNDLERGQCLQNVLISRSTGGFPDNSDYLILRRFFIDNPETKGRLPHFVRENRDLDQFWSFIKVKYGTYAERRQYIYSEFSAFLDFLESKTSVPSDAGISEGLKAFDEDNVHLVWSRALERRKSDPEGAITVARTLLETVCKHILDDRGVEYDPKKIELPELYKLTATELNLSPGQHTHDIFKQILGGCSSVVNGLGALRNKLGDAHGQGSKPVRPAPRHAELAVNLAGSVALFLVATHKNKDNIRS